MQSLGLQLSSPTAQWLSRWQRKVEPNVLDA